MAVQDMSIFFLFSCFPGVLERRPGGGAKDPPPGPNKAQGGSWSLENWPLLKLAASAAGAVGTVPQTVCITT